MARKRILSIIDSKFGLMPEKKLTSFVSVTQKYHPFPFLFPIWRSWRQVKITEKVQQGRWADEPFPLLCSRGFKWADLRVSQLDRLGMGMLRGAGTK